MSDISVQATEVVKRKNPLLEKVNKMPGQVFRIPSKGLLYTNDELDEEVIDGELTVHPMTTLDEIYFKTPDLLFSGKAIDHVFKRCIPQIKKPLELFSNDVDYLLTALRKISYGGKLPIKHKCSACGEQTKKMHEYEIPLDYFLQGSKEMTKEFRDTLKIVLSNGYAVTLRPSKMGEMLELYQSNEDNITNPEDMLALLAKSLSATISDVDGISDKEDILEWISVLPRTIVEEFSGKLADVNKWGGTYKYDIECLDCGHVDDVNAVLNPLYFFILPSNQKTS